MKRRVRERLAGVNVGAVVIIVAALAKGLCDNKCDIMSQKLN